MDALPAYRCLLLVALLYSLPGYATTVYKSVDERGVVTFSDSPPEDSTLVEAVEIDVPPAPDGAQAQQRLEDMRETTDRMVADRMAREKHRAEMRELQAKTDAMQAPQYYPEDDYYPTLYSGGYYNYAYPYRRPYRRGGYVRPEHPISRPPLRPDTSYMDNFPAPHIRPLFTPRTRGAPRN